VTPLFGVLREIKGNAGRRAHLGYHHILTRYLFGGYWNVQVAGSHSMMMGCRMVFGKVVGVVVFAPFPMDSELILL
jgi:hypothetical protein